MPFMKLLRTRKMYKGYGSKVGDILCMDEHLTDDVYRLDDQGNKYFDEDVAELTEEEAARCLRIEQVPL